jgi:hypothetical protein
LPEAIASEIGFADKGLLASNLGKKAFRNPGAIQSPSLPEAKYLRYLLLENTSVQSKPLLITEFSISSLSQLYGGRTDKFSFFIVLFKPLFPK